VRLPRETKTEIAPPTAEQVQAVHDVLPERYRLPLIVLDATGMRLGELEGLRWGDVDERRGRWRVSRAVAKTGHGRWVSVPPVVFEAVLGLVAREDRTADRKVFQGFGGDRFRTAIARGCTTAGVPAFSPHDLRHRRISLLHLGGVPWARIGEHVGQRNLGVTANTYTHVLSDEAELDLEALLCSSGATPGATPERTKRRIAG
jgi:integrase